MKVSVIRPDELGRSELCAWRAMQRSSPEFDNAFLSPEFAVAAGRVRPTARVAVIEEGNDVAGFFPFEQGRLRVGRPIAAGVCDAQALIRKPGTGWGVKDLLKPCRIDVWEFDHLISDQMTSVGRNVTPRVSSIIDVSGGYEAYLAERQNASKKIFKSTAAKDRKLQRDREGIHFEFDTRDPEALRILMRWKSAQYRSTGRRDRFAVGLIEQLVTDLSDSSADGCTGTLSVLYSAEGVVAAHFGLRSDSTLSCWFPAYDLRLARYSPGLLLHLKMAGAAATAGVLCLDLGKGDEEYKRWLRNRETRVGEGWIERPSAVAAARRALRVPRQVGARLLTDHPALRRTGRRVLKQAGSLRRKPEAAAA